MRARLRLLLAAFALALTIFALARCGSEADDPRAVARERARETRRAPPPASPPADLPRAVERSQPPRGIDAGAYEPPPPVSAAHARAIERWLEGAVAPCESDAAPLPRAFLGRRYELVRDVCPLLYGPSDAVYLDPDALYVERLPDEARRRPEENLAAVRSGDREDSSWTLYFDFDATDEIVRVWGGDHAACPFVVVQTPDAGWVERGEILRHLRGPDHEAAQGVTIPVTERVVHVRIEERKNEVTYLDDVYLERGGRRLVPLDCPGAAHCGADDRYARIEPGEAVALDFRVPASWLGHQATLVAEGHYRVRLEPPPPALSRPAVAVRP